MKFLKKLPQKISGRAVVRIYSLLSVIPVPRRYARRHAAHNLQLLCQEPEWFRPGCFIENQAEWKPVQFGCFRHHNMAHSGCEIMAVYNAMLAMGASGTAEEITGLIRHFERAGAALLGDFGVSPIALQKYLQKYLQIFLPKEYKVSMHCYRRDEALLEPTEGQIALITYFNDKDDLWRGIHTICATLTCGGCYLHNAYYRPRGGNYQAAGPYISLAEGFEKCFQGRSRIICTITVGAQSPADCNR